MEAPRSSQRLAIALLAIGQTVAWMGMYYIFASLLLSWERDFGWSKPELTFAITLAVLISGLAAPLAGYLIEAGRGAAMLGIGTFLGGALVAALPLIDDLSGFYLVWALIGLCHAAALYEPCFALLSRSQGPAARGAITAVTLVAGFASAFAFAGGAWIAHLGGWQMVAWVFAALVCLVAAPASYLGARLIERGIAPRPETAQAPVAQQTRRPIVLALGLAFPMMAINHGILLTHLLPLLDERGMEMTLAVTAAALIGPMQVVGRVLMILLGRGAASLTITMLSFAGVAAATLLLLISVMAPWLVFLAVMLQGAAYGLISILKPAVTTELLGTSGIARVLGWMALPYLISFAIAPFLGALIWSWAGYDMVLAVSCGFALAGLGGIAVAARLASGGLKPL